MTYPELKGFPVIVELPVQWGEMDAYGHLNNTVFFRFFESARVEFLKECRFLESYDELNIGAILHSTSCRFRLPLFYPDTVVVGAKASEIGEDRFTMAYRIFSKDQNAIAADGEGIVVSFDYANSKKAPLPNIVVEALERLAAS